MTAALIGVPQIPNDLLESNQLLRDIRVLCRWNIFPFLSARLMEAQNQKVRGNLQQDAPFILAEKTQIVPMSGSEGNEGRG